MEPPSNAMAASAGAGMIDDFRLWGSRRCRRINAPLKKTWWRTQVAHAFDNHNASLSEGAPSPLWFGIFPKRGIGRGITSIFRVLCDKAKRGCASRFPPSPGAPARRTRGVLVEGATPLF